MQRALAEKGGVLLHLNSTRSSKPRHKELTIDLIYIELVTTIALVDTGKHAELASN